jgi:hypothetical protein
MDIEEYLQGYDMDIEEYLQGYEMNIEEYLRDTRLILKSTYGIRD